MTKLLTIVIAASLLVVIAACSKEDSSAKPSDVKPTAEGASTAGTEHAAANVVPGSHEDWCGEHAVPESQCTQCNPTLAAAFKATGDWCEEHGLPESQCLKCNPDVRIVRPAPVAHPETKEQ